MRLSEVRKRAWMAQLADETESMVSLHADTLPNNRAALELALTTVLRRKGRILDSLLQAELTLRAHLTPALREQYDQLAGARSALVSQLYAPSYAQNSTYRQDIEETRTRIEDLESKLGAASADFSALSEQVSVEKIRAALPADAALVEFVRYRPYDPRQPRQPWQASRYVAYVLMPNGPPRWIALGEAQRSSEGVDAVMAAWDSTVSAAAARRALRRLDGLVFAPVRAELTGVSHVILAPDGKLNMVPFEALVAPEGHYALEPYRMSYVTTGRDLLRFAVAHAPRSPAVIVAAPDYGPVATRRSGRCSNRCRRPVQRPPISGSTSRAR